MSTKFKTLLFISVVLLSLVIAPVSQAQVVAGQPPLAAFGPRDLPIPPGTGFPLWYQDSNGLSLGLCTDAISGFCVFLADEFFNPALPVSFPGNFPAEHFYYLAETFAGPLFYRTAIEGGFGGIGNPADGQQAVFSRVRFRADVNLVGNYTIRHPYGTEIINVPVLGPGPDINQTLDIFGLVPLSFNGPTDASSPVGPFLRNAAGNVTDPATGNIYLANPAASVAVTGSPVGQNFVEITDPAGVVIGRSDLFNLAGKIVGNDVNPKSLIFPVQAPNVASAAKTVTVTNISTTTALTTLVTIDGANAADFALTLDTCSNVAVPASGTCTFGVVFSSAAPTPAARTASALVTTVTPTGMPPMRVALSGTIDSVPPTVLSTNPAAGATNVPSNSTITAVFSEPMAVLTVNNTTFTVAGSGGPAAGNVTFDAVNNTATFIPTPALVANQTYTATISAGVTDVAGNPLANTVFAFVTVPPDFTRPTVVAVSPLRNAIGVPLNSQIKVTFDEEMHGASINANTFIVSGGVVASSITFDAATRTATFTPTVPLAAGTAYTVTIKGGASGVDDLAQNTLLNDVQFSFITNHTPAPAVLISPANGATGLPTTVTMTWAKATDDDGDVLEYHIEVCNNQFFIGCDHQAVPLTASAPKLNGAYFAGLGGLGMAVIGLVSFGGIKGRKKFLMLMIVVLLMSGAVISACSSSDDDETIVQTSAAEVSFTASGLNPGSLYFWRIETHDPNGGAGFSETRSFRTQ